MPDHAPPQPHRDPRTLRRSPTPLEATVASDLVLFDPAQDRYFGATGPGARIWELLREPITEEALVQRLLAEYAVDEATCRAEVATFVQLLEGNGLVA